MKKNNSIGDFYSNNNGESKKLTLEWKDINYSIIAKDDKNSTLMSDKFVSRDILKNMNGKIESGRMTAIMGPTGSGKTSLLNVLAGKIERKSASNGKLTGEIKINGKFRTNNDFRKISAYVMQDDVLYSHLTVYETLRLAATFHFPITTSDDKKDSAVNIVMTELGLSKARDTIIGDANLRGVSGGERKRVNIACQLISDPRILFLDEPTSGLDSFQAQSVMESMKAMARAGRVVVSVIHQPRSSIYSLFDRLLLLSEGRTIFMGKASEAVDYFAKQGYPCPNLYNPADYFLDTLSPDTRTAEEDKESQSRIMSLAQSWDKERLDRFDNGENRDRASSTNSDTADDTKANITSALTDNNDDDKKDEGLDRVWTNLSCLAWRTGVEVMRDRFTLKLKFITSIFFAILVGCVYSGMSDDQTSIQNRNGLLFFVTINQSFNGLISVLNTFPKEKVIVNREISSNAYKLNSYFLSKFFVELPINILPPLVFSLILYWIVGLNPAADRVFIFMLLIMQTSITAIAMGLAVSAGSATVESAGAVGPPLMIVCLLFGGFYINVDSLPQVLNLLPYVSFVKWAFQSLVINEYKDLTFNCDDIDDNMGCMTTGEAVLDSLNLDGDINDSVLGLVLCMVFFLMLAYYFLMKSQLDYIDVGYEGPAYGKRLDEVSSSSSNSSSSYNTVSTKEKEADIETTVAATDSGVELVVP